MSKIVIDARELRTSTGRYVERLIHYLQLVDRGHEYIVLLYPKDMDSWVATNPRFTKVACPHKEFTFSEQLGYKRQLQEINADLVHFAMIQQPVLYKGRAVTTMQDLTTMRFRNPSKNPLVFTIKQWVYRWVVKRVARSSDIIITPTQFVKEDVANFTHVNPEKITVTYEAADVITEAAEPVAGLEGKRFIMYVGRPMPHKNLERLIEAFASLQKNQPDLHLVLAGKKDANYERHAERVRRAGIANVVFTDFISDGQLRWLYEHTMAYVFPSLSEGFGLPPLEAMTHGAPVVASNASCIPEVCGEAAYYFNPFSVEDMAAKIAEVLSDPVLREDLCEKGRAQVKKYSWQRMAEQTLEVYNRVLDSRK